jgi:repressor LexA
MTNAPLTRRQRDILDFYEQYAKAHKVSPTLEEVASHFGINKVTVFGHIEELRKKGVMERFAKNKSRGMQIRASAMASSTRVPLLGRIAAGNPIEALETPEEIDLADLVPPGRDCYALRVKGLSMIEDGIRDGDIVLVERRDTARNGETVVAVLPDEEATLKRYYQEAGRVRLQPANASMPPIYPDSLEIRGVVVGVVRRY